MDGGVRLFKRLTQCGRDHGRLCSGVAPNLHTAFIVVISGRDSCSRAVS